jgi:hypothetical protein
MIFVDIFFNKSTINQIFSPDDVFHASQNGASGTSPIEIVILKLLFIYLFIISISSFEVDTCDILVDGETCSVCDESV